MQNRTPRSVKTKNTKTKNHVYPEARRLHPGRVDDLAGDIYASEFPYGLAPATKA